MRETRNHEGLNLLSYTSILCLKRATAGSVQAVISAILVDDEKLASDELAYLLKEFADVEIIATATTASKP